MQYSAFLIAFFTTIIRYYDYALFGLSSSILAQNFLPSDDHNVQLLSFFAIFSGTVIARPIGSLIFGYIGDRYGRVKSVKISLSIATISTSLIAVIPSFQQAGIIATIILIFCRMVFLMSLAGEVDAIKIYIAEKTGTNRKNLSNGIVTSCSQIGALLAALAYYCANTFDYSGYFWRLNFLIGGMFGVIAILMRGFFKESAEFLYHQNKYSPKNKIILWKNAKLSFVIAILINGSIGGIYHFLVIFLGVFLSKTAFIIDSKEGQLMNIILIIMYAICAVFAGFLADRINPFKQIIVTLVLSLIVTLVMQTLLYKEVFTLLCPTILISLTAFYAVPLQIIIQSLFAPLARMRLYSLSHSLGGVLLSSTTPFLSMLLWQNSNSLPITSSFFLGLLIILIISVLILRIKVINSP